MNETENKEKQPSIPSGKAVAAPSDAKKQKLSRKEKKAQIREMICSDEAQKAVLKAKPKSIVMKLLLLPIKWKNENLMYFLGNIISTVKRSNVKLFVKLKANR